MKGNYLSYNQIVEGRLLIKVNLLTSVSGKYYGDEVQQIYRNMGKRKKGNI